MQRNLTQHFQFSTNKDAKSRLAIILCDSEYPEPLIDNVQRGRFVSQRDVRDPKLMWKYVVVATIKQETANV